MAINKNHEFEDLDGVKCAIVEKNVSPERVEFLKKILEYNRYTVVVVKSPPPKIAATPAAAPAQSESGGETPSAMNGDALPPTFTVGVTDVVFNPTNAIMGRLLKTPGGHVVTLAYWNQKEKESRDEIPYFEKN
jgi:hypothetical protein